VADEEGLLVFPQTVSLIHSDLFSFNNRSSGCEATELLSLRPYSCQSRDPPPRGKRSWEGVVVPARDSSACMREAPSAGQ